MKNKITLIIIALLIISASVPAFASDKYELEGLHLSVESPDRWYAVTNNPDDNIEVAVLYGMDAEVIAEELSDRGMYLSCFNATGNASLSITKTETEYSKQLISIESLYIWQLHDLAYKIMNLTGDETESEYISDVTESEYINISAQPKCISVDAETRYTSDVTKFEYIKYEIYRHEQVTFIKFYLNRTFDSKDFAAVQDFTIQNGQIITITLDSFTNEVPERLETVIKDLVDSIVFSEINEGHSTVDLYRIFKYGVNIKDALKLLSWIFG